MPNNRPKKDTIKNLLKTKYEIASLRCHVQKRPAFIHI